MVGVETVAIVVHACMRGGGGGREVVPEMVVAMVAMVVIVHVCIAVVGGRW